MTERARSTPDGEVVVSRDGRVCLIQLRRDHKLNALSSRMEAELDRALASPQAAASRCVVVAGGERAFSAGADLGELSDLSPDQIMAYYSSTGEVYERIASMPQPTVAAISGWCLGGGFELALACDFRVASAGATFGLPEVEIGIIPSSGGTLRLVRAVGPARAKELMLLRTRLTAAEAHDLGLATEVVPGDPLPRAMELAARLAELPAMAASVAKQAADRVPEASRDAAILIERLAYAALAQTDDAVRASKRFADR
jgi:enoyl-CoA hydratase/carnithine racemase